MKNQTTAAQNNFENTFLYRHEERKNVWGLDDEIVEQALKLLEDLGYDYEKNDAIEMYDNLAINAEIIEKDEATEEEFEDALFATDHYLILTW